MDRYPDFSKPFPRDWKQRPEYVRYRIARLTRALPYCRGRAARAKSAVEQEIENLKKLLELPPSTHNSDKEAR